MTASQRSGLLVPLLAFALASCQGLEDFSRSVDEVAARIVPPDTIAAARGAENDASYQLGLKYLDGDGVPQSYVKAAELFREAAGRDVSDAQFLLGLLHWTGRGVAADDAVAAQWFRRAAQQGHPEAQFFLGEAY